METVFQEFNKFKGVKNDQDLKDIPLDFFYRATNYNFQNSGLIGIEKITMPVRISFLDNSPIDGMFEYKFLDIYNKLQVQQIAVCNGKIYKNSLNNPSILRSGLTKGKCSFAVLNDKLYIANGKDYVYVYDGSKGVVSQMGAPIATEGSLGILNGTYYYALTYVTSGGEEVVGSISNSLNVTNKRINLELPLGYEGTTSRKLYRTESNGNILKLLATINDNTTLTYVDNSVDATLTTQITNPNNELPKPYFISVFNERLLGAKCDLYPTQLFITDVERDVFDLANNLDISNYSDDNTSIEGMGIDFSNIVVGTKRHFYLINIDTQISVTVTRVNTGIKDGYSLKRIPAYGEFGGGLMFVSTENDVRILSGLRAIPVSTSVDNIYSENFSQNIKNSLDEALNSPSNIDAEYFNYKYHLVIDGNKFVYDIRTNGWTYHNIQTKNYKSSPLILAIFDEILYNGQADGWIEQEYFDIQYRGEDVPAIIESPNIMVSDKYKFFQRFLFWFIPSENNEIEIQVIGEDDKYFVEDYKFSFDGGAYSENDYSSAEYDTSSEMDYKTYHVNRPLRWIRFILTNAKGNIIFQRWGMYLQTMTGKE